MDQPWNPAVLEQRTGRVHRLGQHRPVRVVHFVAPGTIKHGMLDLLTFKRSLFAGVLEDGADQVLLGGTRLTRFMELVAARTSFLDQLGRFVAALVGRDAKTEQAYLRLPIPSEDTLNRIAGALGALAKAFGLGH